MLFARWIAVYRPPKGKSTSSLLYSAYTVPCQKCELTHVSQGHWYWAELKVKHRSLSLKPTADRPSVTLTFYSYPSSKRTILLPDDSVVLG